MSSYKYQLNSCRHFNAFSCGFLFNNHIMHLKFKILSSLFKFFIFMFFSIVRRWSKFIPWYEFMFFSIVRRWSKFIPWYEFMFFFMNQNIKVMLLHQTCWFQRYSLLKSKFSTSSFRLILWDIFNIMFFSPGTSLQILGAPLYFTILHFTNNY